jgi:hypothetical protein
MHDVPQPFIFIHIETSYYNKYFIFRINGRNMNEVLLPAKEKSSLYIRSMA